MYLEKTAIRGNRLFTYKVAYDKGVAPNPYCGACTLAICKPKIRAAANVGDIVVGFGCGKDSDRIVYCMLVDEKLSWNEYVERCRNDTILADKIPKNEFEAGDCIWMPNERGIYDKPLPSWSRHEEWAFQQDVKNGKNILFSRRFWYFGRGDQHKIVLPPELRKIVPKKQGHRSNSNNPFISDFIDFFNLALQEQNINTDGRLGEPAEPAPRQSTDTASPKKCSKYS